MKFISPILALSVLAAACSTSPGDSKIQQKLVGTWTTDSPSPGIGNETVNNRADGTYVLIRSANATNAITEEGTWQVKGGFFIATPTKTPWPDDPATFEVWSNKVLRIDAGKMVLLNSSGEAGDLVFHKK